MRILVIEDQPPDAESVLALLRDLGHDPAWAETGGAAVERMASERFDVVLLDVKLPDYSGTDLCKFIVSTYSVPVLAITASNDTAVERDMLDAGAKDHVQKPLSIEKLATRIEHVTRTSRQLTVAQGNIDSLSGFFSPSIAELILRDGLNLQPHRARVVVLFLDLFGFSAFTNERAPEEVAEAISAFHSLLEPIVDEHRAVVGRFRGGETMLYFNDPVEVERPAEDAADLALDAVRDFNAHLRADWQLRKYGLGIRAGIAAGYITAMAIGFEFKREYAILGRVVNDAAALCQSAVDGQVLVDPDVRGDLPDADYMFEDPSGAQNPPPEITRWALGRK